MEPIRRKKVLSWFKNHRVLGFSSLVGLSLLLGSNDPEGTEDDVTNWITEADLEQGAKP